MRTAKRWFVLVGAVSQMIGCSVGLPNSRSDARPQPAAHPPRHNPHRCTSTYRCNQDIVDLKTDFDDQEGLHTEPKKRQQPTPIGKLVEESVALEHEPTYEKSDRQVLQCPQPGVCRRIRHNASRYACEHDHQCCRCPVHHFVLNDWRCVGISTSLLDAAAGCSLTALKHLPRRNSRRNHPHSSKSNPNQESIRSTQES